MAVDHLAPRREKLTAAQLEERADRISVLSLAHWLCMPKEPNQGPRCPHCERRSSRKECRGLCHACCADRKVRALYPLVAKRRKGR